MLILNTLYLISVRGAGTSKVLSSDTTNAEGWTIAAPMTSFDSNGFTVEPRSDGNANNLVNKSGDSLVAWSWKAGGAAVSNTDGTITSQVSANKDSGFSIVKFTGSLTSGQTVGHGLSEPPSFVILKDLDSVANWYIYHQGTGTTSGYINYLKFDSTAGSYSDKIFYPINFNSTTFTPGNDATVLQGNVIAYCWHSVAGYSKIGSYTGASSSTVPVTTNFRPSIVIIKNTDTASTRWVMYYRTGNSDSYYNYLFAEDSLAEQGSTSSTIKLAISDTGFTVPVVSSTWINNTGDNYIYMAIA